MARILIGCEESGTVRDAFLRRGHDAWSCDLRPSRSAVKGRHYQMPIEQLLAEQPDWDLAIFHPECTYLTVAAEWAYKDVQTKNIKPGTLTGAARRAARDEAALFFMMLAKQPRIKRVCVENPVGVMSTRWRKPDQYIQPHEYGEDASKRTCLWLRNLPRLVGTEDVPGRMVNGLPRWANQTDSGQNRLPPSTDRAQIRSTFYLGWAEAMAEQWRLPI